MLIGFAVQTIDSYLLATTCDVHVHVQCIGQACTLISNAGSQIPWMLFLTHIIFYFTSERILIMANARITGAGARAVRVPARVTSCSRNNGTSIKPSNQNIDVNSMLGSTPMHGPMCGLGIEQKAHGAVNGVCRALADSELVRGVEDAQFI